MEAAEPSVDEIRRAAARFNGSVRYTPLEYSRSLSEAAGSEVFLKMENLQHTRSFKYRGATAALSALASGGDLPRVVTASAGNHGLGVASAASRLGMAATIFVPRSAPATKRERIGFRAELRMVEGGYDEAHALAEAFARERGAVYIHAFSDPAVVAGQGTVGLEIVEQLPNVGTIVVPVGGGGLIGGIGLVACELRPETRIVGVQSDMTTAMHDSLEAGELRSPPTPPTICEGLSGDIDWRSLALARRVVDDIIVVPEASVRRAVARLYVEEDLIAEGSAAVGAAGLWEGLLSPLPGPVVVVITGGNIDQAILEELLAESPGTLKAT
ncbi:MAG TPA: pyridoxal-phosphate dependent enzyme [Longimicrobiaceae bacterium]|nr:pyridoxal-phosphate dependent enzyme [Longimicrobiaceae bacterium]